MIKKYYVFVRVRNSSSHTLIKSKTKYHAKYIKIEYVRNRIDQLVFSGTGNPNPQVHHSSGHLCYLSTEEQIKCLFYDIS